METIQVADIKQTETNFELMLNFEQFEIEEDELRLLRDLINVLIDE
jgi:hypothetical protein